MCIRDSIQEVKTATEVAKLSQRWFSTSNQNASKFNSACFSFSILSLVTLTRSSSSFKVNCPWHGSNSTNGFLTQAYWYIDGKYLLRLFNGASMVISALGYCSFLTGHRRNPCLALTEPLRLKNTALRSNKNWRYTMSCNCVIAVCSLIEDYNGDRLSNESHAAAAL